MASHSSQRRAPRASPSGRPGAKRPSAPCGPERSLSAYRDRIVALAERIRGTADIAAIIDMIDDALAQTRRLAARDELAAARRKVEHAERSIAELRDELAQVKSLVHQDPLTGTLNRRGIDEAFRREAARADRKAAPICVALLDLDDFKRLNDTHGHAVGDAALRHVAEVIRSTLRPNDQLGRYGGEEFVLLLPDTRLDETATVLARVQRELARMPLPCTPRAQAITFSAGAAQRGAGEALEALVERADAALYGAKRAGKNRVTLAA